jgi:glycosyltransferase involved in cell wall biosynthesis
MNSYLTINPSYVDAFSLVTLESLACGTPVVAYNLPASRHNFGKCKAVFRSPVGNKAKMAETIFRVLTQTNRQALTEEALKWAISYDWNNVVKAERDAYTLVINRNRSRQGSH